MELMERLIPSAQVRNHLQKIGHSFTDFEKATLIWNAYDLTRQEQLDQLAKLAEATEDAELKMQIAERLAKEKALQEKFDDNAEGNYVFVVLHPAGYSVGYFTNSQSALDYAAQCTVKEKKQFSVEKQKLASQAPKEEERIYFAYPVGGARYDKGGNIKELWCEETEIASIKPVENVTFANHFMWIPYPETFEKGAIVKLFGFEEYGVISISSEDMEAFRERTKHGLWVDFSDMAMTVVTLQQNGSWIHEHITPIYLEIAEPAGTPAYLKAIYALSGYWREEKGCTEKEALEAAIQYGKSCRENGPLIVESAETLSDIIL